MDTHSEEHRHACEVRAVLAMPTGQRKVFLDLVEKKRGAAAAQQLRNAVYRAWIEKQAIDIASLNDDEREHRLWKIERSTNARTRGDVEREIRKTMAVPQMSFVV
jgi:hypothetical protein